MRKGVFTFRRLEKKRRRSSCQKRASPQTRQQGKGGRSNDDDGLVQAFGRSGSLGEACEFTVWESTDRQLAACSPQPGPVRPIIKREASWARTTTLLPACRSLPRITMRKDLVVTAGGGAEKWLGFSLSQTPSLAVVTVGLAQSDITGAIGPGQEPLGRQGVRQSSQLPAEAKNDAGRCTLPTFSSPQLRQRERC